MFCREHVVQLHHEIERIHAVGAELVVIGSGKPHFVQGFRELTRFEGPIYCDPELRSYKAAKLHRSAWRMVNPKTAAYAVRAMARGAFQGRTQGDALQQGGVLVILPPDRIAFEHISEAPGDNAPAEEVVAALERALGKSAA